jgi:hypothetical protein
MNVVLHKILGTLDDQVRGRTTSGNTHECYLRPNVLLRKLPSAPRYDVQKKKYFAVHSSLLMNFRKPREQ